jgi:hypothetical protein
MNSLPFILLRWWIMFSVCVYSELMNSEIWIFYTVGRTPWTGDEPIARPLPTQGNTNRKNAGRHPCLDWDSNSRSQCFSGLRRSMPYIMRLLWSAWIPFYCKNILSYLYFPPSGLRVGDMIYFSGGRSQIFTIELEPNVCCRWRVTINMIIMLDNSSEIWSVSIIRWKGGMEISPSWIPFISEEVRKL